MQEYVSIHCVYRQCIKEQFQGAFLSGCSFSPLPADLARFLRCCSSLNSAYFSAAIPAVTYAAKMISLLGFFASNLSSGRLQSFPSFFASDSTNLISSTWVK